MVWESLVSHLDAGPCPSSCVFPPEVAFHLGASIFCPSNCGGSCHLLCVFICSPSEACILEHSYFWDLGLLGSKNTLFSHAPTSFCCAKLTGPIRHFSSLPPGLHSFPRSVNYSMPQMTQAPCPKVRDVETSQRSQLAPSSPTLTPHHDCRSQEGFFPLFYEPKILGR